MFIPSYSDLMDKINATMDLDSKITSRYTIVIAAAKRARQIINGAAAFSDNPAAKDRAVSIAINEMETGKIKILPEGLTGEDAIYASTAPKKLVININAKDNDFNMDEFDEAEELMDAEAIYEDDSSYEEEES